MSVRSVFFGGGYQLVNLILLVFQSLVLPKFLGLDLYGVGLIILLPALLFGGVWEPIVHRFYIESEGFGRSVWLIFFVLFFILYAVYIFLCDLQGRFIVVLVGAAFFGIYMVAIFTITKMQKLGYVVSLMFVASTGLFLACSVFLFPRSGFTVILFFLLYFLPASIYGVLRLNKQLFGFGKWVGLKVFLGRAADAISTRLFYLVVNNLYVIFVGVIYGASKAAIMKIVISICSAFRFSSPYTVGHFYSLSLGAGKLEALRLSFVPLIFISMSVAVVVLLSDLADGVGVAYFKNDYFEIKDFFKAMAWGVPLYLWTPYLTIIFCKSLGFKIVFLISLLAFLLGFYFGEGEAGMFVYSCLSYCVFLVGIGSYMRCISERN